jgi:hypothetical protein
MIDYRIRVSIEELGAMHVAVRSPKVSDEMESVLAEFKHYYSDKKSKLADFVFGRTFSETLDMNKTAYNYFRLSRLNVA